MPNTPLYPLYNCSVDREQAPDTDRWDHQEEFSHHAIDPWTAGIQVLEAWINEHDYARTDPDSFRVRVWKVDQEALRDPHKTVLVGDPEETITYTDLLGAKADEQAIDAM